MDIQQQQERLERRLLLRGLLLLLLPGDPAGAATAAALDYHGWPSLLLCACAGRGVKLWQAHGQHGRDVLQVLLQEAVQKHQLQLGQLGLHAGKIDAA